MIKDLKVRNALATLALTGVLTLSITGCGNKQIVDFNKAFNVALESNGDSISVVGIQNYNDYEGTQVQFVTNDGLRVLSSTHQLQLLNVKDQNSLDTYTTSLQDFDDIVMYYSDDIEYGDGFNKKIVDFAYTFNKAIILKDESALIVELSTWRDYEDDKIQIKLSDGTCILTEVDKVKLVNDENAQEGAIERYATSLVGSKDNVKHYGAKEK
mgnify:CR=1 FL=1